MKWLSLQVFKICNRQEPNLIYMIALVEAHQLTRGLIKMQKLQK